MAEPPQKMPVGRPPKKLAEKRKLLALQQSESQQSDNIKKIKKPRPVERIFDKIAPYIPESKLYLSLLEFEKRLDVTMCRKRSDILEAVKKPAKVTRTLRLYIYNTYVKPDPASEDPQAPSGSSGSWTLRIQGHLLPLQDPLFRSDITPPPKFSTFISRISIKLDSPLYKHDSPVEFNPATEIQDCDGVELKRTGSAEFPAQIQLYINYSPSKYKVEPPLSTLLGITLETKPKVLMALWTYIRDKHLQDTADRSMVMCDPPLRQVFHMDTMKLHTMAEKLSTDFLRAPDPIQITYQVKMSGDAADNEDCYDLEVEVDDPSQLEARQYTETLNALHEADNINSQMKELANELGKHKKRRDLLLGFFSSPVDFVNNLIVSQSNDLAIISEPISSRDPEVERRASFYEQPWTAEAVKRYLQT